MWLRHWNLSRNPFDDQRATFVTIPSHVEAVSRLVHAIEASTRSALLVAGSGLGKSKVLSMAIEATRSPGRRFARISEPTDGADLFARLSAGLRGKSSPDLSRAAAWRALTDSARLCRWQGLQVVLVVDDCQGLTGATDRLDLERLNHLDPDPATRLTVIRLGRPTEPAPGEPDRSWLVNDWSLSVRLVPLTRSETAIYLADRLKAAGRFEATFTPRAITRLQAASGGNPRGINRLASLALMASALRGHEIVPPEIVEHAASECPAFEGSHSIV